MEQQTAIPHQIKDEATWKLKRAIFPSLICVGDGGSRFSICFVQQCSFRETSFSKNTIAFGAIEIESTVSLATSIVFFFLYTGRIHSFINKAPSESNKLNMKDPDGGIRLK